MHPTLTPRPDPGGFLPRPARGWRGVRSAGLASGLVVSACLVLHLVALPGAATAQPAEGGAALAARLERHVGQAIDLVELTAGRRMVRPVLAGVMKQRGTVTALRLLTDPAAPPQTVQLAGVSRIIIDREVVHDTGPRGGAGRPGGSRARDGGGRAAAASAARMRAKGVEPWPVRSAADHAAEVAKLQAFVTRVTEDFPGLEVVTTHEFIFATDIPAAEVAGVVANLDRMHDILCDLYDIPAGEPVWLGKCLVIAFRREEDFLAFEKHFMREIPAGVHGVCHQATEGQVVVAGHQGRDQPSFEHMLVHETTHGFNHRWVSAVKLPNWLNEGIAEWVGRQVVPGCRQVPAKEARSLAVMQATGSVGDDFFTATNINRDQYGIASGLVSFMAGRDRRRFTQFVRGIKEGMTVEESLTAAFNVSLDELLAAYAATLGLPRLSR